MGDQKGKTVQQHVREYTPYEEQLIKQFGREIFHWEYDSNPPDEIKKEFYEVDSSKSFNCMEFESILNTSKLHFPLKTDGHYWEWSNTDLSEKYGIFCMKKKKKTDKHGNHFYRIYFFGKKYGWENVAYVSESFTLANRDGSEKKTVLFDMIGNGNKHVINCSVEITTEYIKNANHSYMFHCERFFSTSNILIAKNKSRDIFESWYSELYEKCAKKNKKAEQQEADDAKTFISGESTSNGLDMEAGKYEESEQRKKEEEAEMESIALKILTEIKSENIFLCEMRQEVLYADTRGENWAKSANKKIYCDTCFEFKKEENNIYRDVIDYEAMENQACVYPDASIYADAEKYEAYMKEKRNLPEPETIYKKVLVSSNVRYWCYKDGKRNRISKSEYEGLYVSSEHDFLSCTCERKERNIEAQNYNMEYEENNTGETSNIHGNNIEISEIIEDEVTITNINDENTENMHNSRYAEEEPYIPPVTTAHIDENHNDDLPAYDAIDDEYYCRDLSYDWIQNYMDGVKLPYHLDTNGGYKGKKKKFSTNYNPGNGNSGQSVAGSQSSRISEGINGGRRRRTGRRREQDDYYRNLANRTRVTAADFFFQYIGSNIFDDEVANDIINARMNATEIRKLRNILHDFFDDPGINIDQTILDEFLRMLSDIEEMEYDNGHQFFNCQCVDNNVLIFENVRLLQTTADSWARFMHASNGNIKMFVDELNKELDIGENKGGCLLNLLGLSAEHAGKTRPCDFENFLEICPDRFFYKYVSNNSLNNHVSRTSFDDGEEINKEDFYEKYKIAHFFVTEEQNAGDGNAENVEKNKEEKKQEEKSMNTSQPNNATEHQDDVSARTTNMKDDPSTTNVMNKLPLDDVLNYYESELMGELKKKKKAMDWNGSNVEINFPNIYHARREVAQYTHNNTTNVSCAVPLTHPFLNRPRGHQGARWTEFEERDLGIKMFRIAIDNTKNVGSSLTVQKNFDRLYNEISEGGDLNYFRPYFGTKWKDVVSKELLQQWVLQTKNLCLNKGTDVARYLRLFLIAQQCSDVVDANVFLNTADLEFLPYAARAPKVRSAAFPDPIVAAEPNLFPFYRDEECTVIGGHRVLPAYTLTMDDFLKYIIFDSPLPAAHAFGAAYTREDIVSGKVAVVFVHPHMQGQASSLTYYTMTHLAGPIFHWTHRQRTGVVEFIDTGVADDGLTDNNLGRVNAQYVDPNDGSVIEFCEFDYCLQANNVRVDGATKGVMYVRTTNFKSQISLVNNANVTLPANSYIVGAGAGAAGVDAPIDLRPVIMNFYTNNQADGVMQKVANWLNVETGNLADYKWAMGLYANFAHVSGMPVVESQVGVYNKYVSAGETAVYSNPPGNAPQGAGRWSTVAYRNILDENGQRVLLTNGAATIASYNYITNMFAQRPHRYNNNVGGDFGYNTKINEMSIYERLGLMIGTHTIADKISLADIIDNDIFEHTAHGKRLACAMHKATDMTLQMTEVPMGYLLEPVYGVGNVYQRTLETKYFGGLHPFSSYMIELFDRFIKIPGSEYFTVFDKLYYHGQFVRQGNNHVHNTVQQTLCKTKWHRDYNTIGYGNNDHFAIPNFTEINWQKKDETYYHDPIGGNAIRWRMSWVKPWTSIDEIEWTRLNVTNIGAVLISGFSNYSWTYTNLISKERQSWISWTKFFHTLGITTYYQNATGNDYICRPFGTFHLLYDEALDKKIYQGTLNSVIPWTMITRGFMFASIGNSAYNKYDIHAPQLELVPNTNRIEVF